MPTSPEGSRFEDAGPWLAERLLDDLGMPGSVPGASDAPAIAWRRAGLMVVTGEAKGPPLVCPVPLTTAADAAMLALKSLTDRPERLPMNGALLLGERARLMGLMRRGRASPNGSCRLLDVADGRIALNLPREDDWMLLPALLEGPDPTDWPALAEAVAPRPATPLVARAVELGMAAAHDRQAEPAPWVRTKAGASVRRSGSPRVLDLSSLWAGPLCASLLANLGADVVKVEHVARPDGARRGDAAFFALLNGAKTDVAIDFRRDAGVLRAWIERADIVIEGSRPRALRQFGVDAEAEAARGTIWVSITGHGRDVPDRIGFGDDAAVAGGLSHAMARAWGRPLFAGDAIADPLAGIMAALAAWAHWRAGRGAVIDIALARGISHAIGVLGMASEVRVWQRQAEADRAPLYPLRPLPAAGRRAERSPGAYWPC